MNAPAAWTIVHLSLRDPLPDLEVHAEKGGLFVVFWCDRIPLGHLLVPARLLPIPAAQVAALVPGIVAPAVGFRTVAGFEPPLPMAAPGTVKPTPATLAQLIAVNRPLAVIASAVRRDGDASLPAPVSVIICIRDRPEFLRRCLAAMTALSPAPREILIVDNHPESGQTRPVTDCFPEVHYVAEPRPGLSVARNTGLRHCAGELVAFTDDDAVVHPAWIGAVCEAFRDPDLMAMTGLVLPAELSTPSQLAFQTDTLSWDYRPLDFDDTFFEATKHRGVPTWRMGAGANMAFRRQAFDRVGLFDERLGAGASGCSEDSELWYRLLAYRQRCRYWPAAVVMHSHRADWDSLRRQMYLYMRGHAVALLIQFERHRHWGNLFRALVGLPWDLVRLVLSRTKQRISRMLYDPRDGWVARPVAPQIWGTVAGYGYYLRHRVRPSPAHDVRAMPTGMAK